MRSFSRRQRPGHLHGFQLWGFGQDSSSTPTLSAPTPVIASFSPTSANAGDIVTISGSGFTGATTVTFNGMVATFSVVNDSQITATVPSSNQEGAISVQTSGGQGDSPAAFSLLTPVTSPTAVAASITPASIVSQVSQAVPSSAIYLVGGLLLAYLVLRK